MFNEFRHRCQKENSFDEKKNCDWHYFENQLNNYEKSKRVTSISHWDFLLTIVRVDVRKIRSKNIPNFLLFVDDTMSCARLNFTRDKSAFPSNLKLEKST